MKRIFLAATLIFFSAATWAQEMKPESTEWYKPVPEKVVPADKPGMPPSDAVVLFDGKDFSHWTTASGETPEWKIENGAMVCVPGKGDIFTRGYYGDCQLHVEFCSPAKPKGDGQGRGNSGVFLQSTYEVQILDGDDNPTYVNGMVGSIYKQAAPLSAPYKRRGEWQVYDIFWKAPVFGTGGEPETPGMITVLLNGVLVQNNYILKGTTEWIGFPQYRPHGRLPLMLQNHGDPVAFRNIWIRDL